MKEIFSILLFIGLTHWNFVDNRLTEISSNDTVTKVQSVTEHLLRTGELYKKTLQPIEIERKQDITDSINLVQTLELALKIAHEQKGKIISRFSQTL